VYGIADDNCVDGFLKGRVYEKYVSLKEEKVASV
jgi:hypothetical protein